MSRGNGAVAIPLVYHRDFGTFNVPFSMFSGVTEGVDFAQKGGQNVFK